MEINEGVRGGIRIKFDGQGFEIDVRHANGDVEYTFCNRQHLVEEFKPYIGVMATNAYEDNVINDIDLAAIYIKNRDSNEYQDKNQLD